LKVQQASIVLAHYSAIYLWPLFNIRRSVNAFFAW
jgi:hypothetical protein